MTSFGWKRKSGESVKKQSEAGWTEDSKEEEARPPAEKKAREESKFQQICRLKEEGIRHAEREEFWHSVSKFDVHSLMSQLDVHTAYNDRIRSLGAYFN